MLMRDTTAEDFPAILALNEESVEFLSPLDRPRLVALNGAAEYHRVATRDGDVVAFLLALREGQDYDSPNYRWFAERYPHFLYIDRIVVSKRAKGTGIGQQLYTDLFGFAQQSNAPLVACEFDIDPPNPASERFHARFGFREVGRHSVANGKKQVSLQAVVLDHAALAP